MPDYPEVKLDVSLGGVYRVHPLFEAIRQADLRMYENKSETREWKSCGMQIGIAER